MTLRGAQRGWGGVFDEVSLLFPFETHDFRGKTFLSQSKIRLQKYFLLNSFNILKQVRPENSHQKLKIVTQWGRRPGCLKSAKKTSRFIWIAFYNPPKSIYW